MFKTENKLITEKQKVKADLDELKTKYSEQFDEILNLRSQFSQAKVNKIGLEEQLSKLKAKKGEENQSEKEHNLLDNDIKTVEQDVKNVYQLISDLGSKIAKLNRIQLKKLSACIL